MFVKTNIESNQSEQGCIINEFARVETDLKKMNKQFRWNQNKKF